MYKRDLITSEIEKLAQVLARIVGLKKELKEKEAELIFDETLLNSFKLDKLLLATPDDEGFAQWLNESEVGPEKLNTLSDFLFSEIDFENNLVHSQFIAKKLMLLYKHLVDHYQIVHLINLGRQKYIEQYLE